MDTTQYVAATAAVIGLVNGVSLAFDRDWRGFTLFLVGTIAGTVFGFFHMLGLPSLEIGLMIGLNSSGIYKGFQLLKGIKK